ncbi:MAG TPA: arginine--tRNA ligase [Armatimonadota bacterium]|nr:arginine--tRNA ligase [Armatimonadota bacterium]
MIKQLLADAFTKAAQMAKESGRLNYESLPAFGVERPANPAFGDFSVNLAMVMASQAKMPPRQVAQVLVEYLRLPESVLDRVEIAGPGFMNLYLKPTWMHEIVQEIHRQGDAYGRGNLGQGRRVLAEYVSANPNGPLSIPHGRGAIIGDVLSNVLDAAGFNVSREFYVNDAATSTQMQRFGESLVIRYLQAFGQDIEFPEDGYHGGYVVEFANKIKERDGDKYVNMPAAERLELFTEMGKDAMIEWQRDVLASFGVEFDQWFRESTLIESGAVEQGLKALAERGETYEAEGAIWLASTKYGDDKDRALVRTNGKPTYLASDVAYHRNKFERGFDILIDIWGPDHHGYIARTKAAMAALGYSPEQIHILIYQVVRLMRNGEFVMGGKRKGDIILLSELIEQVGRDAARFFFLLRSSDSDLNFDLDLAIKESADNPVYYVQYAHARIASIGRTAEEKGFALPDPLHTDLSPLTNDAELSLIRRLADFPEEIKTAAELYEPHRLTRYAQELAREFHVFYDRCPVLKEETTEDVRNARLVLVGAAKITLKNVLTLLGVSAPERM